MCQIADVLIRKTARSPPSSRASSGALAAPPQPRPLALPSGPQQVLTGACCSSGPCSSGCAGPGANVPDHSGPRAPTLCISTAPTFLQLVMLTTPGVGQRPLGERCKLRQGSVFRTSLQLLSDPWTQHPDVRPVAHLLLACLCPESACLSLSHPVPPAGTGSW